MSTSTISNWGRQWSLIGAAFALLVCGTAPRIGWSQSFDPGEGIVQLSNWPDPEARRTLRYDILPYLDTLTITYRYDVRDGIPWMAFTVDWQPGAWAIYQGARIPFEDVPGEIKMAGLDLRLGVRADGDRSAKLSLVVDSMVVGPAPDFVEITLPDLTWENVFANASAEETRAIFLNGFELFDIEIAGAAFAVFGGDEVDDARPGARASHPRRVSIYRAPDFVDVFVDVNWLIGGFVRYPTVESGSPRGSMGRGDEGRITDSRRRGSRPTADREATRSRGERDSDGPDEDGPNRSDRTEARGDRDSNSGEDGRSSEGGKRRGGSRDDGGFRFPGTSDDDDDDDDDDKLVPYAIAAASAAGILAIAGGTVGYYGSPSDAPIGLTSGFVGRDGGLLLQVAVNEALLLDEPRPKQLKAKLLSFGNFFHSSFQPAIGAGVLATSEGSEIVYEPSITIGAVNTYKMLLFYGGFDVIQMGPEFGVALNFRALTSPRE